MIRMPAVVKWTTAALVLAGGIARSSRVRAGDESLLDRVRREYPPALARLEARYATVHGVASQKSFTIYTPDRREDSSRRYEFGFTPTAGFVSIVASRTTPEQLRRTGDVGNAYGYNPEYSFKLNKKVESEPWAIRSLDDGPASGERSTTNVFKNMLLIASRPREVSLKLELDRNVILFEEAQPASIPADPQALMIRFRTNPPANPKREPGGRLVASIVVSPNDGWALRSYFAEVVKEGKVLGTYAGQVEYRRAADGQLEPAQVSQRAYRPGKVDPAHLPEAVMGYDLEIEPLHYEARPDSAFRLPAFGLPDISAKEGVVRRPVWPWFALGAVVTLVLAVALRVIARRTRPVAPAAGG